MVLDTLKQHCYMGREGEDVQYVDLLLEETKCFELPELVSYHEDLQKGGPE